MRGAVAEAEDAEAAHSELSSKISLMLGEKATQVDALRTRQESVEQEVNQTKIKVKDLEKEIRRASSKKEDHPGVNEDGLTEEEAKLTREAETLRARLNTYTTALFKAKKDKEALEPQVNITLNLVTARLAAPTLFVL